MVFQKGVSGNPKGKPKGAISIKQQIKQYYQVHPEELHKRIARLATEAKYDQMWLSYVDGLPMQKTDVTIKAPTPILPSPQKALKGSTLNTIAEVVVSKGQDTKDA